MPTPAVSLAARVLAVATLIPVWLASPAVARADDPEVVLQGNRVQGRVRLQADATRVKELIADPREVARIDAKGVTVDVVAEGTCIDFWSAAPTILGPVRYRMSLCPSAGGFTATLVESEDFDAMEWRWTVEEDGEDVVLSYELTTQVAIDVPQALVNRTSRRTVRALLARIRDELES